MSLYWKLSFKSRAKFDPELVHTRTPSLVQSIFFYKPLKIFVRVCMEKRQISTLRSLVTIISLQFNMLIYLIRINFRADKISRKFAQRRWNARKFIQELRAESRCTKINPRENFRFYSSFDFRGPDTLKCAKFHTGITRRERVRKNLSARQFSDFAQPGCAKICPRENLYE